MSEQNTDTLIERLTGELTSVQPLQPFVRFLTGVTIVTLYLVLASIVLGIRPDLVNKFKDPFFLFETALATLMMLTSVVCAAWLCIPDMRGRKWLISLPFTLGGIFLLWTGLRSFTEGVNMPLLHWDHCFEDGMFLGAVPAAWLVFTSRRGATTHPYLMAVMNAMAVGAGGYVALRFTCVMDTVGHAFIFHLVPFIVFGLITGLAGRRIFNW